MTHRLEARDLERAEEGREKERGIGGGKEGEEREGKEERDRERRERSLGRREERQREKRQTNRQIFLGLLVQRCS